MVGRSARFFICASLLVVGGCNDNGLQGLGPDIAASPGSIGFTAAAFAGGAPSASMTVILSNEGGGALKISDISITQSGSELSWQFAGSSSLPLDLSAGSWVATQIVFTPSDTTADSAMLVIRSNDGDEDPLEIPITTEALGPQLSCTPNPVTFVQAPGTPTTRTVACSNVGNMPLNVTGFAFAPGTSSEFTSSFTPVPQTLDPGDPLAPFSITYTPSALGPDAGAVLIANNGGEYTLNLTGEGTDQPLCDLSAFPFFVDFGTQILGQTTTKTVLLSNSGNGQCDVNGISVAALTAEYTYTGGQSYTIAPNGSQIISVNYRPIDRFPDFGVLNINSNDPAEPQLGVLLTGNGKGPEVDVLPCPVEFGLVTVGCKVDRTITIYNTGDANLTLSASLAAGGSPEFSIVTNPPATLGPNQSATMTLRLAAANAGAKSRMLTLATNDFDEPMFQCELKGTGTTNDHQTDTFTQPTAPMADILFIVDNSGSMGDEQQTLATSFQGFANYLVSQNASYHVGVTTTDMGDDPISGGEAGKLVGNPKIIDNNTPNGAQKFAQNANVGTNGSGTEQGLEGARRALTAPLVNTDNAGFLRQQAKLFLVFVSDEEDQSPDGNAGQPSTYFINAYRNVKGVNNPQLLSANAIAGDVPNGCSTAAAGARYKEVVDAIGGVFSTICTNDFSPALNAIGVEATQPLTEFFLSRVPVPATIVVKVNNVVVSNWTYNATGNSIVFATAPALGATIVVDYDVVCEMP